MAETYVAFCRVCEQVRYKSSRPLEAKEKPNAADFVAVGQQPSPETFVDTPITCYHCIKPLVFFPESNLGTKLRTRSVSEAEKATAEAVAAEGGLVPVTQPVPRGAPRTIPIFAPEIGEDIKLVMQHPMGVLVTTSRRVVLIQV